MKILIVSVIYLLLLMNTYAARQSLQTMERTTTLPVSGGNVSNNTANSPFWTPCYFNGAELKVYTISSVPSNAYYINLVMCCLVNALLTFSTIILNSLTVLAYWKSSQLRKKTCYFLVMLLSSCDFAIGLLCNSRFTVFLAIETLAGHSGCTLLALLTPLASLFTIASLAIFMVLHFERYLGICHVFVHRNKVTKPRCLVACLIVFFALLSGPTTYLFIDENAGKVIQVVLVSILVSMITFMYVRIFFGNRHVELRCHASQIRNAREMKFAKSCIMVVGASMICFLPVIVYHVVKRKELQIVLIGLWAITSYFANATVNSIIFFWKNRVLRNEGMKILRRTSRKLSPRRK